MKKLFLFLSLLSFALSGQNGWQIGVPYANPTTSLNMSPYAVITPSIWGSTSANGILNLGSTTNATKGIINIGTGAGTLIVQNPTRIGSSAAPSATLDVTGTMSVSSTATISGSGTGVPLLNVVSTTTIDNQNGIGLYNNNTTSASRNWAILTNDNAYGDFCIKTSNAIGGNPFSSGSRRFYINASGNVGINNFVPSATLDVTGTMSVSSTATISGALTAKSTMSLGSANLTGGNTGTVAVLSDLETNYLFQGAQNNPANGTTYYFGNVAYPPVTTPETIGIIHLPYDYTLIGYEINYVVNSTTATAQNSTIAVRINNTTDVTLNTSVTYTAAYGNFNGSLNTNGSAGDYINIKEVTPTWSSSPVGIIRSVLIRVKRR